MAFKAETKKVLHLVTHSLYSNKDIFLRELISNASDAIDKVRFESLTNADVLENNSDWKIKITPNKENNTLTISDNGIGMSEAEVIENIGTIARSGTQAFAEILKQQENIKDNPELIGQFGVGFYSAFMVADKVTLITRKAGDSNAIKWECDGEDEYTIGSVTKDSRGTDVILHMNEENKDYLEEWKIKEIVSKYSDYIEFPVSMDVERTEQPRDEEGNIKEGEEPIKTIEEETLNTKKAIWLRDKSEITEDEYHEFYKHISHDYSEPLKYLHYKVEGTTEFSALIFIPKARPMNMMFKEQAKNNVHLYVKRVFIMKESDAILPDWLRFISGVVDSGDLPLNISRETLQEHRVLQIIKKNLVSKLINTFKELRDKEFSTYKEFYEHFGVMIKEGVYTDFEKKEDLLSLLIFNSLKNPDEMITIDKYIEAMPEDQEEIYFISGESKAEVERASHLEIFKEKGYDVLYFVEAVDEIMMQSVFEYKGKKFKNILKGDINLGEKDEKESEELKEKFKSLNDFIKGSLDEYIKEVKVSDRLTSSACCLVGDEHDLSAHMEKLMKAYNKDMPKSKRILEINPKHPILVKMQTMFEDNKENPVLKDFSSILYDQALIAEGSKIPDPVQFNEKISDLMLKI